MGFIFPGTLGSFLAPGAALPLDLVSGAGAAYSTRKLRSAYSGSALRVRRDSDNAEADIGFSGNDLNTAALLAHCGAGSGFLVTWYDQSGNARDIGQATAASQPRIVNAGVLDTQNGKPVVGFGISATSFLFNTSAFLYANGSATVNAVASGPTATNQNLLAEASNVTAPTEYRVLSKDNGSGTGTRFAIVSNAGGTVVAANPANANTIWNSTLNQFGIKDTGSAATVYVNGLAGTASAYTRSGTVTPNTFAIGCKPAATPTAHVVANVAEVIIHSSALSDANRQALEGNQKSYFATP